MGELIKDTVVEISDLEKEAGSFVTEQVGILKNPTKVTLPTLSASMRVELPAGTKIKCLGKWGRLPNGMVKTHFYVVSVPSSSVGLEPFVDKGFAV